MKRIYLRDFIDKVMILWEGTKRDVFKFGFQILDLDYDGILNGIDLLTV